VPPLMVMAVIDRVLSHHSMSTLTLLSVLVAMIAVFETLLGFARREIIAVLAERVDTRLNLHIFSRLLGLSISYFERHPAGYTIHRLSQTWKVRDFMTGKLLTTFLDGFTLLVLLPVLFYMSAALAWMVLAGAVLIAIVILIFLPPMRRVIAKVIQAEIEKSTVMVESVHGVRTVKSLAIEPQQRDLWDLKVANAARYRLEAGRLGNWPNTIVTPIERFIERGVLLVGAYLVLTGAANVDPGALIAFMLLGVRVAAPLVGMARLIEDMEEVRSSIGEVGMVLNQPSEMKNAGEGLRPRFSGAISFEKVDFAYPGSKTKALEGVSFSVPAGTMLGVVGKSGSGKSTITRLIFRFYEASAGRILIDGEDIRDLTQASLRAAIGVVPQDTVLFNDTIAYNIAYGRPGASEADITRAARLAQIHDFIARLPQGYATRVGERGLKLSGGERQRIAIARTILKNPRLLILDEATSALDTATEREINAALRQLVETRTTLVIAHRLSTVVDADEIIVLAGGTIAERGTHATLLEKSGLYAKLWAIQADQRHPEPLSAA
jgi:subfamily B ATP-binding cassette protein HlyB/CyaB